MNTELIDLKNLQETDDRLRAIAQAAQASAAKKSEAEARLKGFEAKLAKVTEAFLDMNRRHRELEAEVKDLSAKRDNNRKRQSAARSSNEVNALAKEEDFLAGRINSLEDEILDLLDKIEKAGLEKADLALVLTEEAELYSATAAAIEEAAARGEEAGSGLCAKREALLQSIPSARLKQYEEIRKIRAGRAVAPAAGGMCQACGLSFPPQLFNNLQRNESIQTCPNCGRVLYWRDHPDFLRAE